MPTTVSSRSRLLRIITISALMGGASLATINVIIERIKQQETVINVTFAGTYPLGGLVATNNLNDVFNQSVGDVVSVSGEVEVVSGEVETLMHQSAEVFCAIKPFPLINIVSNTGIPALTELTNNEMINLKNHVGIVAKFNIVLMFLVAICRRSCL